MVFFMMMMMFVCVAAGLFGYVWPTSSQTRPSFDQHVTTWGMSRPALGKLWPNLGNISSTWPGQVWSIPGRNRTERATGQMSNDVAQKGARSRPSLARVRPILNKRRPIAATFGPESPKVGPMKTELGPNVGSISAKLGPPLWWGKGVCSGTLIEQGRVLVLFDGGSDPAPFAAQASLARRPGVSRAPARAAPVHARRTRAAWAFRMLAKFWAISNPKRPKFDRNLSRVAKSQPARA